MKRMGGALMVIRNSALVLIAAFLCSCGGDELIAQRQPRSEPNDQPADSAPLDDPPLEQPPIETPPVEQPPIEDPPVVDPPVEDPPASWKIHVFAHSASELYSINPQTLAVRSVGPFVWPGAESLEMKDIAIDAKGLMVGVTKDKFFHVDLTTAHCTFKGTPGVSMNSLSFIPAHNSDPTGPDRLLGATTDGLLYEVNRNDGWSTLFGDLGRWSSSGDMVSVAGVGTLAMVYKDPYPDDWLVSIDLKSGWVEAEIGSTALPDIFGLGYWDGVLYGFSNYGYILEIDPITATATIAVDTGLEWAGGGVTTVAPQ